MPSSTVPGKPSLLALIIRRLEEVAVYHGGRVPLHGRLFAQWMHHAYPRECRYPHVSGTTDPLKTRLTLENYKSNSATKVDMRDFIGNATTREGVAGNTIAGEEFEKGCAMWTMEEELVVWPTPMAVARPVATSSVLRSVMLVGVLMSGLAAGLVRIFLCEIPSGRSRAMQKCYV